MTNEFRLTSEGVQLELEPKSPLEEQMFHALFNGEVEVVKRGRKVILQRKTRENVKHYDRNFDQSSGLMVGFAGSIGASSRNRETW